ncbi:Uncharacterized protein BP5553_10263 [Venustampulla echinocandica]|uniref:Uncharacterized protein n=1 Tax=Venustampulla echinocandica TaxID=2656787 RepID=A0A370T9R8_9HELO|nr:Uncharacterized protein BP5553_10263 [Venustampulla echinocandica]RDL30385.1 Uncharacterized protein BP5553_10263 [Venustampulla echinocandica]
MASQHILATAPSQDAMLNSLLELVRAYNARIPRLYAGLNSFDLDATMPLLLNLPSAPLACREPPAEFEAVNAHFSAQVHAFFHAVRSLEDMADKQSADELDLIRQGEGLRPVVIRIVNQSFDIYPDCLHRTFHTRRLTVKNPDRLPLLTRGTQLRVFPDRAAYSSDTAHMRPVSLRTPLELATRLPHLRELDCPWLWERLPMAFASRAARRFARVWEGPWRDDRAEFGRGVRHVMPFLLPSSLTKARLWFWKPDPGGDETDQAAQMPDLVGASSSSSTTEFDGMDPVSLGLRDLGSRLEELDICALITPDLFPSGGDGLSWPQMRHLKVEFHPCAPDGSWYFSGPRGEDPHAAGFAITREEHYPPGQEDDDDDDDETHALWSDEQDEYWGDEDIYDHRQPDMFRTLPIAERINPLLLAFASSLQQQKMPSLQDAELFTWLTWRPSEERAQEYEGSDDAPPSTDDEETVMFRWGVRYDAPQGDGKGTVTWQVGEDWRPEDEIIRAFEDLVGGDGENMEWKAVEFVGEREQDPDVYI